MSHKFSSKSFCFTSLIVTICFASVVVGQTRRFRGRRELLAYTRNLPVVDKVELLKLKLDDGQWHGEIEASKILKGSEAQNVASLWRRQTYLPNVAACHNPAYGIRFYAGEKLLVDATVCWDCKNIGFLTPRVDGTQYFEADGKKGRQLLELFRQAFPAM